MRGLRKLTLDVQLTHPRTNKPHEGTDDIGNSVELRIQDRDSNEFVAIVTMHPVQFAALIAGRQIIVDAESTANVHRLGLEMQNDSVNLGRVDKDAEVEVIHRATADALAAGWESVDSHHSNQGLIVRRRRWARKAD